MERGDVTPGWKNRRITPGLGAGAGPGIAVRLMMEEKPRLAYKYTAQAVAPRGRVE